MLVLEKLSKTYQKPPVLALNEVSLRFPDKGMVFIVGKSGCGKSTLLNVLGGLDKFDAGEFTFRGKSLKDFSNAEYENYRNHNVGFVFQESNLLESFTVGENLALALDLQGKVADKGQIESILNRVGLSGIADRKVIALSGGQRQRVAVARALIKDSDFMLADEPTGNLDSTSARELFEILKEISKEKLMIVVSHDMEAAQTYGDRIVEMSDGKVIRDTGAPAAAESVEEFGEPTKKKGQIKFPKIVKLSARNLQTRVIRLIVMIFLFAVSVSLFGTGLSAYNVNLIKVSKAALSDLAPKSLTLSWTGADKHFTTRERNRFFTQDEVAKTETMLGYKTLPIYCPSNIRFVSTENSLEHDDVNYAPFYNTDVNLSGLACLDDMDLEEYGLKLVAGHLPENVDEIALPYYAFLLFQQFGMKGEKEFDYQTPENILGKTVKYLSVNRKIVGVIDTGLDVGKYEALKQPIQRSGLGNRAYTQLNDSFWQEIYNSLHTALFISFNMKQAPVIQFNYLHDGFGLSNASTAGADTEIQFIEGKIKLEQGEITLSRRELLEELYINQATFDSLTFSFMYQQGFFDEMGVAKLLKDLSEKPTYATRTVYDGTDGNTTSKEFRVVGINKNEGESYISDQDMLDYWMPKKESVIALAVGCAKNPERYDALAKIAGEAASVYASDEVEKPETLNVSWARQANIENIGDELPGYSKLGLYGSILFCVFSVVLILNFFATTIKDKHKDIGVLLALGTGRGTIFAIYFMEALIVTLVAVAIATGFSAALDKFVDALLIVDFRVLRLSLVEFGAMFLLGLIVAFVGSAGPIFAIARRKPAEVIRS